MRVTEEGEGREGGIEEREEIGREGRCEERGGGRRKAWN